MKQVLLILCIVLLWFIIDCVPINHPDFIFPDDSHPNGIPSWALNPQNNLPSENLQFPGNFPSSDRFRPGGGFPGFPPPGNFPPGGGFPSQLKFPQGGRFPGFPPPQGSPPQGPPPRPPKFIEPSFTTVSIADINTITTTPSPAFHICMQSCPVTSEYNPLCGSNKAIYYNLSKLRCAQRCGTDAQIVRKGSCKGLFPMQIG